MITVKNLIKKERKENKIKLAVDLIKAKSEELINNKEIIIKDNKITKIKNMFTKTKNKKIKEIKNLKELAKKIDQLHEKYAPKNKNKTLTYLKIGRIVKENGGIENFKEKKLFIFETKAVKEIREI